MAAASMPLQTSRLLPVAGLGVLLFGLLAVVTADSARLLGQRFPGFFVWNNGYLVSFHTERWTGARAGLPLNGGQLIGVDGEPFRGGGELLERTARAPLGTVFSYRVQQGGVQRVIRVPSMRLSLTDYLLTFGNYLLNAAFCFAIALVALYLRPDHAGARSLAMALILLGCVLGLAVDLVSSYRFVPVYLLCESLLPAAVLGFGLQFPVSRLGRRHRRTLLALVFGLALAMGAANSALFYPAPGRARALTSAALLLLVLATFTMIGSFAYATWRGPSERARLQAAVVLSGALVSFLLSSVAILAFFVLGWTFSFTWMTALIFFFPLSVLYAIVRYDLFDAERFIRVTLGYTVATSAVVIGYAGALTVLDHLAAPRVASGPAASFALLVVLALSFDPLRRSVQRSVDRVFFRSVADAGRVLEESGTELSGILEERVIRDRVAQRLREALGLEWAEVEAADSRREAPIREPLVYGGEVLGTLLGGPKRSGAPFAAADRELARALAAQAALAARNLRSLQDLREAQDALIRSERLAVVGEFAGAVAHGIRNPLAGIRAAAQIARERAREGPLAESLDGILAEADRLEQRIRTLLDFSRPFEPRLGSAHVAELLESVQRALLGQARRKGVRIEIATETERAVLGDVDYLEDALLELAGNALRAVPEGGRLELGVRSESDRVVIRVADTGPGIPPALQPRIFDLFFTTRSNGTGMGLATVRKVVERMGGTVQLESSSASGSIFRIELQAAPS